jgi:hypothetical protein
MEAGTFSRMGELDGFADAVEALAAPPETDAALSDLTAFAKLMLEHADTHPFGFVHAVTPVAGARTLLAHLPDVTAAEAYAHVWHVDAAIAAGFVPPTPGGPDQADADADADERPVPSADDLVGRAVEHGDPHVVKFTEASLREHARRPDPAYLRAARHVLETTPPW